MNIYLNAFKLITWVWTCVETVLIEFKLLFKSFAFIWSTLSLFKFSTHVETK